MNTTQLVIAVGYGIAVLISIGILIALLRSIRPRHQGETDHDRLAGMEVRWGMAVVVMLLSFLFLTIFSIPYDDTKAGPGGQKVEVNAQQFGWSVQPAEVRRGVPVEFTLRSKDVQHGFGVYDGSKLIFQVQVPAKGQSPQKLTHTFEEAGTYDILCLEFCGFQHHAMRGSLRVR